MVNLVVIVIERMQGVDEAEDVPLAATKTKSPWP